MSDVLLYLFIAAIGGIIGNRIGRSYSWMEKSQNIFLVILIASLGVKIGLDDKVMSNFGKLGFYAFLLTVFVMAGSVCAVTIIRKFFGINRYGCKNAIKISSDITTAVDVSILDYESESCRTDREKDVYQDDRKKETNPVLSASVLIIISIVLGISAGIVLDLSWLNSFVGGFIKLSLCALLFVVGMSFGVQGDFKTRLIAAGPLAIIVPVGTILGSLGGAALASLLMPISIREGLAIGSGFGWYSLAPGIMMEKGYVMAGTIAFIHNIFRELFGILIMPFVAKKIGYPESVSLPGSSCMDVCLPIIKKSANAEAMLYAFFSGSILAVLTPVLVAFFVS